VEKMQTSGKDKEEEVEKCYPRKYGSMEWALPTSDEPKRMGGKFGLASRSTEDEQRKVCLTKGLDILVI